MADDPTRTPPDSPTPEDTVRWESRNAQRAGMLAIAAGALTLLGSAVSGLANSGRPRAEDRVLTVIDTLERAASGQPIPPGSLAAITEYVGTHTLPFIIGAILMGLGTLLAFVPLGFLYRAARARTRLPRIAIITAAVGSAAFGIGQAVTFTAYYLGARDFAQGSDHTNSAAAEALSNSGVTAGQPIAQVGQLALALGFALVSLHAMRAGLLTRFMGFLGMIVGGTLILPLDQFGIIRSFWLVAVGLLILGRLRGGRPPAWEKGEAVPWPTQQEVREQREAARRERDGEAPPRGRDGDQADSGPRGPRVPRARAPQPRRPDTAAGDDPGAASAKRKRKRRT
ncbi:MAG: hypothetical protein QOD55_1640 [Solirubrobacteraceae bacterium]|nr:hypothetical protein [Solirubrobacteraceae bacterium]